MGSTASGLTTSLRSLVSALQTNQATLSFLSDNISNVNTVGYTKRMVSQETQVSSGSGVGVNITQIRRSVDEFLLKSVRSQLSKVGESNIVNSYLDRLQNFTFGDPNSKFTINNSLSDFYSRLEGFSNNPSSAVNRNLAINSANDFATGINELSRSVQNERLNADTELSTSITDLNNILSNLSDINAALRQSASVGGDKQSLEDARDVQIGNLKQLISADLSFDSFGAVAASISSTELLGFSQKYKISYDRASSVDNFINDSPLNAITISALDDSGNLIGNPQTLLSASTSATRTDSIPAGKLHGLIDLRDNKLPAILNQLDTFAYTYADAFNEVHNSGTGFPPARTLTGTESFKLSDSRQFTGKTMIAVTDSNGQPVLGRYGSDKVSPLVIDFSRINGANGFGTASVQNIINEINSYYGQQADNVVNIGSAKDIKLGAVSSAVSSVKASGSIAFSGQPTNGDTLVINGTTITFKTTAVAATDVQIGTSLGTTLANLANTLNISNDSNISPATYSITGTSLSIKVDRAGASGNAFTLDDTGTSVATESGATLTGGTNASGNFTFDFDFANHSTNGEGITFDVTQVKVNAGAFGAVTFDPYTQNAGDRLRTDQNGVSNDNLAVSLTGLGLQEGDTFTVTATINVVDTDGTTKTEDVTFTVAVPDPDDNIKNTRYEATAIGSGDGEMVSSSSSTGFLHASLVNANGTEVTDPNEEGFLQISSVNSVYRVSIDQLDSNDGGDSTQTTPSLTATNRGFSHLFGLNNFFDFGNALHNAANSLSVKDDIVNSPSLLSGGKVKKSVSLTGDAAYTYEIGAGSNESVLELLRTQDTNLTFAGTGTLPELITTVGSYATEIYNYSATLATDAKSQADKNELLKSSLDTKIDEISGVNLDEELAKTIEIQNAYSAAAKTLAIVRELFQQIEQVLT